MTFSYQLRSASLNKSERKTREGFRAQVVKTPLCTNIAYTYQSSTDDNYGFSCSSCLYPYIVPSSSWLKFSAFVFHSHCTNIIRILILFICLLFLLIFLQMFFYFSRILHRLCLITPTQSTTLKYFCICLQFVFIFLVVVSIIIYLFIWIYCVCFWFHLIFFIPIIIVTFQMCVVIVGESSRYFAKSSPPSTSFKFFCICLTFSYFLLSLRSY